MQCVILAGGLATRLQTLTKSIPKSLINIAGKPFLQYQIELLKNQNITNIVLCVGHLAEKIVDYFADGKKFGVNLTYSYEKNALLGTGGALKHAEKYLQQNFFLLYGDSYLPIDFNAITAFFTTHRAQGCMVVYKNNSQYDQSNVIFQNDLVIKYAKKTITSEMQYIDYGLSILNKDVLAMLPKNINCDLATIFTDLANKKQLLGYETKQRFYEIGSFAGLQNFIDYITTKSYEPNS